MEMDCSVAYQHTDGYRNHDGSNELRALGALVNMRALGALVNSETLR